MGREEASKEQVLTLAMSTHGVEVQYEASSLSVAWHLPKNTSIGGAEKVHFLFRIT